MAIIYCFSGTGNSLYAARKIASGIGADVAAMDANGPVCSDEVIGFVFPTYFLGLPPAVERFVRNLEITARDPYIFAITTYGGFCFGVIGYLQGLLREKGHYVTYGRAVKAIENYVPGFKITDTPEVRAHFNAELDQATADLASRAARHFIGPTFINSLVRAFFPAKHSNCDRHFQVADTCSGCGICRDICPVGNIRLENARPVFKHACDHCIACLHACPAGALDWKGGAQKRGRYRHAAIPLPELVAFTGNGAKPEESV
jgi:ferredoxin/flavodoxin